jgi:hypothetical protein
VGGLFTANIPFPCNGRRQQDVSIGLRWIGRQFKLYFSREKR